MMILLDAGHGIDTPGKRSPDGRFLEYKWNREVAFKVWELLSEKGFKADFVVTETNDIPLSTRVRRINTICKELGKDNVLLLSIHSNASGNGRCWMDANGWSCYTSKGDTLSDSIAEVFYSVFEEYFNDRTIRRDMSDGDSDCEADFYIIKRTPCPALLLENFFFDNHEECEWLLLEETKNRIAEAIVEAVERWRYEEGC